MSLQIQKFAGYIVRGQLDKSDLSSFKAVTLPSVLWEAANLRSFADFALGVDSSFALRQVELSTPFLLAKELHQCFGFIGAASLISNSIVLAFSSCQRVESNRISSIYLL